jgi:hypothetical protein
MPLPARRSLLAALLATVVGTGCDATFRPIEPAELQYSVFGVLDVAMDTQWIRVTPIRPLVTEPPAPLPARVTLENLETGRVIELKDSIFQFDYVDPGLESEGLFLHNFWTTEPIEPGATYRFAVRGDDGRSSETTIEIPPPYEVEVWIRQAQTPLPSLFHFVGLKHVALIGITRYFTDNCGVGVERVSFTNTAIDSVNHRIPAAPLLQSRVNCGPPGPPGGSEFWVAGSGAPWPRGDAFLTRRLNVPEEWSEISRSVGFVGGIFTKVVPVESCQIVVLGPSVEHCKLRYDGSTAVLKGTIWDPLCRVEVSRANVRLTEIDPGLPTPYRVRPTASDTFGNFRIGALQAGLRHELSIRKLVDGLDQYHEFIDTLSFMPGDTVTREIEMRRVTPCQR